MTRRRLVIAATAALLSAGTLGASAATADTAPTVRTSSGDYIACAGVRTVQVAVCVEEPFGPLFDRLP
ncbi:MAG: hypothetical protein ACLGIC_02230 [Acidimicrobiia bacterium]